MPPSRHQLWASLCLVACGGGSEQPSLGAGAAGSGGSITTAGAGGSAGGAPGGAGGAAAGKSGAAGNTTAGSAGAAGKAASGSAGTAGQSAAGAPGTAGSGGTAGSATGGASGAAGTGATAGGTTAGAAGSSGTAGSGGAAGKSTAGSGGAAGSAGAGTSGSAGAGGSAAGACPGIAPGPTGHLTKQTIVVKGATRGYSLDVPAPLDSARAYPLVFVLHGDGGTGEGIRGSYGFAALAGNDAIFVYPDAVAPAKSWNVDTPPPNNPDIDLFDGLLTTLSSAYCVDAARVFAAGMSRGGFFANRLGCDRGDKLRAIAPHSGSLYAATSAGYDNDGHVICTTDGPAVIQFHGASDAAVPAKDGRYARDQWVFESTCGKSTVAYSPSPCVAYQGCEAAHPVVWCEVPGLGHALWSEAPSATWTFFQTLK